MNVANLLGNIFSIATVIIGLFSAFLSIFEFLRSRSHPRVSWRSLTRVVGVLVGGIIVVGLVIVAISVISKLPSLSVTLSPLFLAVVIAITLISITTTLVYSRQHSRKIRASNYSARISELTKSLTKASAEVDRILQEMAQAVRDQESIMSALKQEHTRLQTEIDILKKAPEADKLLTEYMARLDKKNTKAQWIFFGIGTLIGVVSIALGYLSLHH